jgi:hypothetical protein
MVMSTAARRGVCAYSATPVTVSRQLSFDFLDGVLGLLTNYLLA